MITYEQALDQFSKAKIDFSTNDVVLCVENDILPTENPLQAAQRKSAERAAVARLAAADRLPVKILANAVAQKRKESFGKK